MTPVELASRMKDAITNDVMNGVIPEEVGSFSELHDYVDANLYGGTEALLNELDAEATTDEEHCAALTAHCDIANPAMDAVDAWIKSGGIKGAMQKLRESGHAPVPNIGKERRNPTGK